MLLTALGRIAERPALILASRSTDFQSAEARALLQYLSAMKGAARVDMDAISPRQGILAHIAVASKDDRTARFLSKIAHKASFQRYILALKALKTNGLLMQGDDGALVVAETPQHGAQRAYLATIKELVAPLETSLVETACGPYFAPARCWDTASSSKGFNASWVIGVWMFAMNSSPSI